MAFVRKPFMQTQEYLRGKYEGLQAARQEFAEERKANEYKGYRFIRDVVFGGSVFFSIAGSVLLLAAWGLALNIPATRTGIDEVTQNEMGMTAALADGYYTYSVIVAITSGAVPLIAFLMAQLIARFFMEKARELCKLEKQRNDPYLARSASDKATTVQNVYIAIAVVVFVSLGMAGWLLGHAAFAWTASAAADATASPDAVNAVYYYQLMLFGCITAGVGHLLQIAVTIYLAYQATRFCMRKDKVTGYINPETYATQYNLENAQRQALLPPLPSPITSSVVDTDSAARMNYGFNSTAQQRQNWRNRD